jgi:hypothetical protein
MKGGKEAALGSLHRVGKVSDPRLLSKFVKLNRATSWVFARYAHVFSLRIFGVMRGLSSASGNPDALSRADYRPALSTECLTSVNEVRVTDADWGASMLVYLDLH